jgi:ABC-type glycerol-3-phosphate transport system permease component
MTGINEYVQKGDPRRLKRSLQKKRTSELLYKGGLFVFTTLLAFLFIFPFYWLIRIAGVWPTGAVLGEAPSLIIDDLSPYNFARVIAEVDLAQYTMNSVIVSAMAIITQLIVCSLAAYALTKAFIGKKYVMAFIVTAMVIPFETIFLTDFLITWELGLIDTYTGLVIVVAVSIVNILILHDAFSQVPTALADAARMDGASELYILFGIYWPISKPALATVTILTGVFSWNMYLWPLLVVQSDGLRTLPLALVELSGGFASTPAMQYAFTFLALLPLLIVFLLLQKYFIRSVARSSLKS